MTKEGYVPPIHDFSITTPDGDDITSQVLSDTSYVFLLVAPFLEHADDSRLDLINEVYEYAKQHGYAFYGLTSSSERAVSRWCDMTGADYEFCLTDGTTLKTIVRSNPGLVLLKHGTVVRKWSHNRLPELSEAEAQLPLEQLEIGHTSESSVSRTVSLILLWFVLPLMLLAIADRMWMWSRWVRRQKKKKEE